MRYIREAQLRPKVALCLDDGRDRDYTVWQAVSSLGVPMTLAINANKLETQGYMTRAQFAEIVNSGTAEIAWHAHDHNDMVTLESGLGVGNDIDTMQSFITSTLKLNYTLRTAKYPLNVYVGTAYDDLRKRLEYGAWPQHYQAAGGSQSYKSSLWPLSGTDNGDSGVLQEILWRVFDGPSVCQNKFGLPNLYTNLDSDWPNYVAGCDMGGVLVFHSYSGSDLYMTDARITDLLNKIQTARENGIEFVTLRGLGRWLMRNCTHRFKNKTNLLLNPDMVPYYSSTYSDYLMWPHYINTSYLPAIDLDFRTPGGRPSIIGSQTSSSYNHRIFFASIQPGNAYRVSMQVNKYEGQSTSVRLLLKAYEADVNGEMYSDRSVTLGEGRAAQFGHLGATGSTLLYSNNFDISSGNWTEVSTEFYATAGGRVLAIYLRDAFDDTKLYGIRFGDITVTKLEPEMSTTEHPERVVPWFMVP